MSNRTTEKQRRRLAAVREERAREEYQRQMDAWLERVAESAVSYEERRICEAGFEEAFTLSRRDDSLDRLRARFADAPADLLERAYDQGVELREKGADVALLYRRNQITELAALEAIEAAFPGFSIRLYKDALGQGMFLTR